MQPFAIAMGRREIRRLLERRATVLVLGRELTPDTYLLGDEDGVTIRVTGVRRCALRDLDFPACRAAGHRTQRDFFDAWYERHGIIDPDRVVTVAVFVLAEDARWLHRRVHRGYTHDPAESADYVQALDRADLERYADSARWRDDRVRRELAHAGRIANRAGFMSYFRPSSPGPYS
jgi:hypothetical protein